MPDARKSSSARSTTAGWSKHDTLHLRVPLQEPGQQGAVPPQVSATVPTRPKSYAASNGTEIFTGRSEREATAVLLAKDADARKRTQQPIEGIGIGPGRLSELVTGARAVGEQISDAQRRGNVDRLGHTGTR
jgi:hypothetical protein